MFEELFVKSVKFLILFTLIFASQVKAAEGSRPLFAKTIPAAIAYTQSLAREKAANCMEHVKAKLPDAFDYVAGSRVIDKLGDWYVENICPSKGLRYRGAGNNEKMEIAQNQKLWEQIQAEVGISSKRQIPMYLKHPSDQSRNFSLITYPKGMYVNMRYLSSASYGYTRFGLFHEAIHVKNNDVIMHVLINNTNIIPYTCSSLIGSSITLASLPILIKARKLRNLPACLFAFSIGASSGTLVHNYSTIPYRIKKNIGHTFHNYVESRSDRKAAEFVQCASCIRDMADVRANRILDDYLDADELNGMADRFENTLCTVHEQQKSEAIVQQKKIAQAKKPWWKF